MAAKKTVVFIFLVLVVGTASLWIGLRALFYGNFELFDAFVTMSISSVATGTGTSLLNYMWAIGMIVVGLVFIPIGFKSQALTGKPLGGKGMMVLWYIATMVIMIVMNYINDVEFDLFNL